MLAPSQRMKKNESTPPPPHGLSLRQKPEKNLAKKLLYLTLVVRPNLKSSRHKLGIATGPVHEKQGGI